jgi:hypothetical protein
MGSALIVHRLRRQQNVEDDKEGRGNVKCGEKLLYTGIECAKLIVRFCERSDCERQCDILQPQMREASFEYRHEISSRVIM